MLSITDRWRWGRIAGFVTAFLSMACAGAVASEGETGSGASGEAASPYQVSGPYTHENLAVYLIHSSRRDDREYLTLDEGLSQGVVRVSETKPMEADTLLIENKSNLPVYIQEGSRLKGGYQDRCVGTTLVINPHSGTTTIPTFCVEQGRGNGPTPFFTAGSSVALAPKNVRLMAKIARDQKRVWQEVAHTKSLYEEVLNASNQRSTLNEALDDAGVIEAAQPCLESLEKLAEQHADAVGVVFAVNGGIQEVDIYPGHPLFAKLYPRLLSSYASDVAAKAAQKELGEEGAEAVSGSQDTPQAQPAEIVEQDPDPGQVLEWINLAEGEPRRDDKINGTNRMKGYDLGGGRYKAVTLYRGREVHWQWFAEE